MICEACEERCDSVDACYYDDCDDMYLCEHCAYEKYGEAQDWDYPHM